MEEKIKQELEEKMAGFIRFATECINERGELQSMVVGIATCNGKEEHYVVPFITQSSQDKQEKARVIKELFRSKNVHSIAFMSEMWYVRADKNASIGNVMPSQHPDREEGLMVTFATKDGGCCATAPLIRLGKKVSLGKLDVSWESIDNLFGDYFKGRKHEKQALDKGMDWGGFAPRKNRLSL